MTNILAATSFGATSTTEEVLSGVNLKGKRIFVTGVSAGIGVETARSLAAHGAEVVGAARDLNKAKTATEQVRKDAAANGGSFELVELDLANLKLRALSVMRLRLFAAKKVADDRCGQAFVSDQAVLDGVAKINELLSRYHRRHYIAPILIAG